MYVFMYQLHFSSTLSPDLRKNSSYPRYKAPFLRSDARSFQLRDCSDLKFWEAKSDYAHGGGLYSRFRNYD